MRKAFLEYRAGWRYLRNRFFLAPKILRSGRVLARPATRPDLSVHILTSRQDMILAVWSLASFYAVSSVIGKLYIHDDGTLRSGDRAALKKLFPDCQLVASAAFLDDYAAPLRNFPVLFSEFRQKYPQYFSFKKIIDPYVVSDKPWRLILDGDILWFRDPVELRNALANPAKPSLMQYNNAEILGTHYNAGIILYHKDNFDIPKFIDFLDKLDTSDPGQMRFADQLGHAAALRNLSALSAGRYTIKERVTPNTAARHYTGPRRPKFYIEGLGILKDKFLS